MTAKYLIVVDMQNDFVNGSLGTKEAETIVPNVVKKVKEFDGTVIFTQDTHAKDYLKTQEGRLLPVEHCIENTDGWKIVEPLDKLRQKLNCKTYKKECFGSVQLAADMRSLNEKEHIESIELVGLCTDVCVVSNAILLKAFLTETPVLVDASCCAGVTPDKHLAALETMKSVQIKVKE
jgi:nicotinamidase-related amidase